MAACRKRYRTDEEFLKLFNPGRQYDYCRDLRRVYTGTAPTLSVLSDAFGRNVAEVWLMIQIRDLSEFSGCKDKLSDEQVDEIAKVIISSFADLKVTELMHFFLQFKSGRYGRFYGSVDGLAITEALRRFYRERHEILRQYDEEDSRRKDEIERTEHRMEVEKFRARLKEDGITIRQWLRENKQKT